MKAKTEGISLVMRDCWCLWHLCSIRHWLSEQGVPAVSYTWLRCLWSAPWAHSEPKSPAKLCFPKSSVLFIPASHRGFGRCRARSSHGDSSGLSPLFSLPSNQQYLWDTRFSVKGFQVFLTPPSMQIHLLLSQKFVFYYNANNKFLQIFISSHSLPFQLCQGFLFFVRFFSWMLMLW